ncbi:MULTISPECIES: BrnT family toxin [Thiorhodovibrio]|nr:MULTISPECIES: BrnT family toxin [Thiorhodovibrio]
MLGTNAVVITHTETKDTIHIISMRKAESDEIEEFFSYL